MSCLLLDGPPSFRQPERQEGPGIPDLERESWVKWEIEQLDSVQTMREENRGTPKEEAVSRPSDTNLHVLGYSGEQNVCHMTLVYTGSFLQTLAVHLGLCYIASFPYLQLTCVLTQISSLFLLLLY